LYLVFEESIIPRTKSSERSFSGPSVEDNCQGSSSCHWAAGCAKVSTSIFYKSAKTLGLLDKNMIKKTKGRTLAMWLLIIAGCTTVIPDGNPIAGEPGDGRTRLSDSRMALVIGNADYEFASLNNPVNDARLMATTLEELGFDVTLGENLDQKGMKRHINDFGKRVRDAGVRLFYYAGHGMQVAGRNYLIPVEADIEEEEDVELEAVRADRVLSKISREDDRLNIVILDACRDNPYARSSRSSIRGLAPMESSSGTIIAFSTMPGTVASDGPGQEHSTYSLALTEIMREPGLTIEGVFKKVRAAVMEKTGGEQTPMENTVLLGDFYLIYPEDEDRQEAMARMDRALESLGRLAREAQETAEKNIYQSEFEKENSKIPLANRKGVQPLTLALIWRRENAAVGFREPQNLCDIDGDKAKDIRSPAHRYPDKSGKWFSGMTGEPIDKAGNVRILVVDDLDGDASCDRLVAKEKTISFHPSSRSIEIWYQRLPETVEDACSLPDTDDDGVDEICAVTRNGFLLCISGMTGQVLWTSICAPGKLAPAKIGYDHGNGVVLATDREVSLVEGKTGKVLRKRKFRKYSHLSPPAVSDVHPAGGDEIIFQYRHDTILCHSCEDCRELWRYSDMDVKGYGGNLPVPCPLTCPALEGRGRDVIAVLSGSGEVVRIKGDTGDAVWTKPIGRWVNTFPGLIDINNDGIEDVVVASTDGIIHILSGLDGETIRRYPLEGNESGSALIALADFIDAGTVQVAALTYENKVLWLFELLSPKGRWHRKFNVDRPPVSLPLMSSEDANGDGFGDAIIQPCLDGVGVCSGVSGEVLWMRQDLRSPDGGIACFASDADGDGVRDIFALCNIQRRFKQKICCLSSATGKTLWEKPVKFWSPLSFHFDDDHERCSLIIADVSKFIILDCQNGDEVYSVRSKSNLVSDRLRAPVFADLDRDGKTEVIVCSQGDGLAVYNSDLSETLADFGGAAESVASGDTKQSTWLFCTPLAHDVNGDGIQEIICCDRDGELHCYSIFDEKELWSADAGGGYRGRGWISIAPSAAGVSREGEDCIVTGGFNDGVYCFKASDGSEVWHSEIPGRSYAAPVVRDIDGDGVPEVNVALRRESIKNDEEDKTVSLDLKTGEIKREFDIFLPFGFLEKDDGSPYAICGYAGQNLVSQSLVPSIETVVWPGSHKITSPEEAHHQGSLGLSSINWPPDIDSLAKTRSYLPAVITEQMVTPIEAKLQKAEEEMASGNWESALTLLLQAAGLGDTAGTASRDEYPESAAVRTRLETAWQEIADRRDEIIFYRDNVAIHSRAKLIEPSYGAVLDSSKVKFRWTEVPGTAKYRCRFSAPENVVTRSTSQNELEYDFSHFNKLKTEKIVHIQWSVKPEIPGGEYSADGYFTIDVEHKGSGEEYAP